MAGRNKQEKPSGKKCLRASINKLGMPSESVRNLGKSLKGINGQFDAKSIGLSQGLLDRIASACGAFNGVDERMKSVSKFAGHSSAFGRLADQIAKQQGLVDSLKLNSPDLEDVLKNNSDHLSKLQP